MKTIIRYLSATTLLFSISIFHSCGSAPLHLYESTHSTSRALEMAGYGKTKFSASGFDFEVQPILAQQASIAMQNQERAATTTRTSKKEKPDIAPNYGVPPPYIPGFPYFCDPYYYSPNIVLGILECKPFHPQIYAALGARVEETELSKEVIDEWYLSHSMPYNFLYGWAARLFYLGWEERLDQVNPREDF